MDAVVDLRGVFAGLARQVRPADGADEHGVAGEDEPGVGSPPQVRHTRQTLSGVWPGVWRTFTRVLPSWIS